MYALFIYRSSIANLLIYYLCYNNRRISIKVVVNRMENLLSFTSIITLLAQKHPSSREQFLVLRTAITQWYKGVESIVLQKNKQIMKLKQQKYEPSSRLTEILFSIQQYFIKINKYYNDPNLKIFQQSYKKIMNEFEFMDVDFSKFEKGKKFQQQQTQTQSIGNEDSKRLFKIIESKEEEIKQLRSLNNDIVSESNRLQRLLKELRIQGREKDEMMRETQRQIQSLRQLLEKIKKEELAPSQYQQTYRSSPEIKQKNNYGRLIFDTLEELQFIEPPSFKEQQTNSQAHNQDYLRALLSQSIAIEEIISQINI